MVKVRFLVRVESDVLVVIGEALYDDIGDVSIGDRSLDHGQATAEACSLHHVMVRDVKHGVGQPDVRRGGAS